MNFKIKTQNKFVINGIGTALSIICPLMLYPILGRMLPANEFGAYIYGMAISGLYVSLTDFGFNVSISKELAILVRSRDESKAIVHEALWSKLLICTVSALLFWAVFAMIGNISGRLLFAIIIYAVFNSLSPSWYYMATGNIHRYSLLVGISRVFGIVGVFALLYSAEIGPIQVVVVLTLFVAFVNCFFLKDLICDEKLKIWRPPKLYSMLNMLNRNREVGLASAFVCLYTSLNPILLGMVSNLEQVSIYGAVEKVYKSIEAALATLLNVFYKDAAQSASSGNDYASGIVNKLTCAILIFGLFTVLVSLFFGPMIFHQYYGSGVLISYPVLVLMSFIPMLGLWTILWGNFVLVPSGQSNKYMNNIIIGAVANIVVLLNAVVFVDGAIAASIATFFSSCILSYRMYYNSKSKHV